MKKATDFRAWAHDTLADLAKDLTEENARLRADLRTALDAYRQLVKDQACK